MRQAARRIEVGERRARLALRHRLAPSARADEPTDVVEDLVALHGTDPASVYLAAAARMREPKIESIESELYEERRLVRMLGMRRTMFVVPLETAPVVQAACTRAIAARERRNLIRLLEQAEIANDAASWLESVENETLRALAARGGATGAEIGADVPRLRSKLS